MDIFLESHKKFLLLLLQHKVEFILIGGYAVIYYGYERGTEDMDLWLKPTNANRDKFIAALKEHGVREQTLTSVRDMDFRTTLVMYIGEKPNTIEFLTKVQGVAYEEANKEKVMLPLKDKQIPVIQYHHLVLTKIATGRTKDKADIEELQKIRHSKKKTREK